MNILELLDHQEHTGHTEYRRYYDHFICSDCARHVPEVQPRSTWLRALALAVGIFFTLVMLFCFAGCGDFKKMPNQGQAEQIVWWETYNEYRAPPGVEWVYQKDFNCSAPTSDGFVGFKIDNMCDGGTYVEGGYARVAWPDGEKYSTSAYAHELLHAHLYFTRGNGDASHSGPEWQPGGLLDQANQSLKKNGL